MVPVKCHFNCARFGLLFASVWWLIACSKSSPPQTERQLTHRVGDARSPVLSRDGMSIAFAAVAPGYTNPQIWVGRADGSAPPRPLTNDEFKNYDPEFSPDGRSIYFTSTREPQGIYLVPSFGGAAVLAIPNAYSARISPDGRTILYGNGGKVVRRSLAGGESALLLPEVDNSYAPIWSPDAMHILVTTSTAKNREPEWWIVGASSSESRKISLGAELRQQGFNYVAVNGWLAEDWIVFTGKQGETQTLWKVQLNSDGRPRGKAVRATTDEQGDSDASFTAGKMVFCRTEVGMNFWALEVDSSGRHVNTVPSPLTLGSGQKGQQSTAEAKLLYSEANGDRFSLFLQDLKYGTAAKKQKLRDGFFSVLAPEGAQYAYGEGTKERLNVYLKSLSWWPFWSTLLCENCGMPRQFSSDAKELLLWVDTPGNQKLSLLDLDTRRINPLISTTRELKAPSLSRDGHWLSFVAEVESGRWQAFVGPVSSNVLSTSDWIPITPVSDTYFLVFWSGHDNLLYSLSSHGQGGNLRFLDALQLDAVSKHPLGPTTTLYEFDETLVPGMDPIWNNISVDRDRIVLELGGVATDVWIK
jgi:Tol biopolymer transport system component